MAILNVSNSVHDGMERSVSLVKIPPRGLQVVCFIASTNHTREQSVVNEAMNRRWLYT